MRVAVLCALLLLACPAVASAGRVERQEALLGFDAHGESIHGGQMLYRATPGTSSAIEVTGRQTVEIHDSAGVEAGPGCVQNGPNRALCDQVDHAVVEAGDGDDTVVVTAVVSADNHVVRGGDGDDRIQSIGTLEGGAGADVLQGDGPRAWLDGGPGPDELLGGPGRDAARYARRVEGVHADLEGDADDGAPGEGDRIDRAVEDLIGGTGADVLTGDERANTIDAGDEHPRSAADRVSAGGGNDAIEGTGDDHITAGDGRDSVRVDPLTHGAPLGRADGGPGGDSLMGTIARERLVGGPGEDIFYATAGADLIDAADGERDSVSCQFTPGDERARARVDAIDVARWCGELVRTEPARLVVEGIDYRGVLVSCPEDHGRRCRARVRLTRGPATLIDTRIALRPGSGERVVRPRRRRPLPSVPVRLRLRVDTRDASGRLRSTSGPAPLPIGKSEG